MKTNILNTEASLDSTSGALWQKLMKKTDIAHEQYIKRKLHYKSIDTNASRNVTFRLFFPVMYYPALRWHPLNGAIWSNSCIKRFEDGDILPYYDSYRKYVGDEWDSMLKLKGFRTPTVGALLEKIRWFNEQIQEIKRCEHKI
jgi:hypothetical protein